MTEVRPRSADVHRFRRVFVRLDIRDASRRSSAGTSPVRLRQAGPGPRGLIKQHRHHRSTT
jgi:hypothetical protein